MCLQSRLPSFFSHLRVVDVCLIRRAVRQVYYWMSYSYSAGSFSLSHAEIEERTACKVRVCGCVFACVCVCARVCVCVCLFTSQLFVIGYYKA